MSANKLVEGKAANLRRTAAALLAIHDHTGYGGDRSQLQSYVGEMLANMRHLCDEEGLDFDEALLRSQISFDEGKDLERRDMMADDTA